MLTIRVEQASNPSLAKLDTRRRYAHPNLSHALARTMMKRHWAPTILDGYAYHGRPQKPRRLILAQQLHGSDWLIRAWLTHRSRGRCTSFCEHCR
jgi:hypothetical protein